MELNTILQYATLLTVVVGLLGVGVAVLSHNRETNASIYLDLSQRLQNIYHAIPAEARAAGLAGEMPPEATAEILTRMLDFLHLAKTAFVLHRSGYLSGKLWAALSAEIERGLRLELFVREWPRLRAEFEGYQGFLDYVDRHQRK